MVTPSRSPPPNEPDPFLFGEIPYSLFPGFYLGFFVGGGESTPKNFWSHAAANKNFLPALLGVPGACSPGKFRKDSVEDWLRSHFWTLVIFIDSLISSSNKINI